MLFALSARSFMFKSHALTGPAGGQSYAISGMRQQNLPDCHCMIMVPCHHGHCTVFCDHQLLGQPSEISWTRTKLTKNKLTATGDSDRSALVSFVKPGRVLIVV